MNRNLQNGNKHHSFNDVIPAFLTPDHILSGENKSAPNIIDLVNSYSGKEETPDANRNNVNDLLIRESLNRAVAYEKLDLFMQPIVTLPQRRVTFYEFYGRLRTQPGVYVDAGQYMKMASEESMISSLDTIFLMNCLKVIKKQHIRGQDQLSYFINIKPFTLRDRGFMGRLLSLLSSNKNIAEALIFEMHYNDFIMLSPAEKKIINGLSKINVRFSLDHLSEIPTNFKYLRENHISFIKVNSGIVLRSGKTEEGFSEILSKKHNLDVNNIDLIIEKTENEHDLREILDYDIGYGQGFLFGSPDFQGAYM